MYTQWIKSSHDDTIRPIRRFVDTTVPPRVRRGSRLGRTRRRRSETARTPKMRVPARRFILALVACVIAAFSTPANAAPGDGICQYLHTWEVCNTPLSASACRAASSLCVWSSNDGCSFVDNNDALWDAAVQSSDSGSVFLRAQDATCNATATTQSACDAGTSGWCEWGEALLSITEQCTVNYTKFYTDACRSSATYSPASSSSRAAAAVAAALLSATAFALM